MFRSLASDVAPSCRSVLLRLTGHADLVTPTTLVDCLRRDRAGDEWQPAPPVLDSRSPRERERAPATDRLHRERAMWGPGVPASE
jgi:hypothetical protein